MRCRQYTSEDPWSQASVSCHSHRLLGDAPIEEVNHTFGVRRVPRIVGDHADGRAALVSFLQQVQPPRVFRHQRSEAPDLPDERTTLDGVFEDGRPFDKGCRGFHASQRHGCRHDGQCTDDGQASLAKPFAFLRMAGSRTMSVPGGGR